MKAAVKVKIKRRARKQNKIWLFFKRLDWLALYFLAFLFLVTNTIIYQTTTKVTEVTLNRGNNHYVHASLAITDFNPSQKLVNITQIIILAPELQTNILNYQDEHPEANFDIKLYSEDLILEPTTDFDLPEQSGTSADIVVIAKPNFPGDTQTQTTGLTPKGITYPSEARIKLNGSPLMCPFDSYEAELNYKMNVNTLQVGEAEFPYKSGDTMPFMFYERHLNSTYQYTVTVPQNENHKIQIHISRPWFQILLILLTLLIPLVVSSIFLWRVCRHKPLNKIEQLTNIGLIIALWGITPLRGTAVPSSIEGVTLYDIVLFVSIVVMVLTISISFSREQKS